MKQGDTMKILHLADLHLGKRVNEYSMLEDQKYILDQILDIIDEKKPDCVIIAGDIYDRQTPPAEAVTLFDGFINSLHDRKLPVMAISGNHDSAERLAFGARIMEGEGIYFSPVYRGRTEPVVLKDEYGEVRFYLLPFIRPAHVRGFFENDEVRIADYTDAVNAAVTAMNVDFENGRNVLIAHQFVTGASAGGSEEMTVGGIENVESWVFDGFDYTALGHIHRQQQVGSERIMYSGTPLKYSLSEVDHEKVLLFVDIDGEGNVSTERVALGPLRDMRQIRDSYANISAMNYSEDYISIILTDEEELPDVLSSLRIKFPNIMKLSYDNKRSRAGSGEYSAADAQSRSPLELFGEFYEKRNGSPLSDEQTEYLRKMIETIWEGSENETEDN